MKGILFFSVCAILFQYYTFSLLDIIPLLFFSSQYLIVMLARWYKTERINGNGISSITLSNVTIRYDALFFALFFGSLIGIHSVWQQSVWVMHQGVLSLSERVSAWITDTTQVERASKYIYDKTNANTEEGTASLLVALFTGRREYLLFPLQDIIRRSGISHLLALSGFHLSIMLFSLNIFKKIFAKHTVEYISLVFVWGYCIWVGFIPSLWRAAGMYSISIWCRRRFGTVEFITIWSLTSISMVIVFPSVIRSVGFILSQLALLGVVYAPKIGNYLLGHIIPSVIGVPFYVGIGATFTTTWYSYIIFGTSYPIGIAVSILLSPVITIFMLLGLVYMVAPSIVSSYIESGLSYIFVFVRGVLARASGVGSIHSFYGIMMFYAILVVVALLLLVRRYIHDRKNTLYNSWHPRIVKIT